MTRATSGSVIYRPDLGTKVMEFVEGPTMANIGTEIMPLYPTPLNSSSYPVIPKEALLKIGDTARSPRGAYQRDDWEYERGTYQTVEHGREELVDDSERELLDQESPGMADSVATERAFGKIMKAQEKRIADTLFNTNNFSATSVTTEWDTAATCTPVDDVNTGTSAFRLQCGMLPDALVIAWETFVNLKNCDQIVDRLKYTFPGIDINTMSSSQLAAVLNVPRVLVGGSVYDSAGKGIAASVTDLWSSEYAALVKISTGRDLTSPGVGRTFLWSADSAQNPIVEQYREEEKRSDVFRVRHHVKEELMQSKNNSGSVVSNVAAACVYLMDNIHT